MREAALGKVLVDDNSVIPALDLGPWEKGTCWDVDTRDGDRCPDALLLLGVGGIHGDGEGGGGG